MNDYLFKYVGRSDMKKPPQWAAKGATMEHTERAAAALAVRQMVNVGAFYGRRRLLSLAAFVAGKYHLSPADIRALPESVGRFDFGGEYLQRLCRIIGRYQLRLSADTAREGNASIG